MRSPRWVPPPARAARPNGGRPRPMKHWPLGTARPRPNRPAPLLAQAPVWPRSRAQRSSSRMFLGAKRRGDPAGARQPPSHVSTGMPLTTGIGSSSDPWKQCSRQSPLVDSEECPFSSRPGRLAAAPSFPPAARPLRARDAARLTRACCVGPWVGGGGGAVADAPLGVARGCWGGCAGWAHQRTVAAGTRPPPTPKPPPPLPPHCSRSSLGGPCVGASGSFSLPCLGAFDVPRPPHPVAPFPPSPARGREAGAVGQPHFHPPHPTSPSP